MPDEPDEDLLLLDSGGVNTAMRAEAAARAQAVNNWTMAALVTANGGASLALLSHAHQGPSTMIALGLYMLGITAALVAGRLGANFAHETEALFVNLITFEQSSRHLLRAHRSKNPSVITMAQSHHEGAQADVARARQEFEGAIAPGTSLGLGVMFFFLGCIAAGVALF